LWRVAAFPLWPLFILAMWCVGSVEESSYEPSRLFPSELPVRNEPWLSQKPGDWLQSGVLSRVLLVVVFDHRHEPLKRVRLRSKVEFFLVRIGILQKISL
jgi:hypothetical protein